jgi:hypothetical protein
MPISFFALYALDDYGCSSLNQANTVAARPLRQKAGPCDRYAVALVALLRNASRSELIVSASLVGMPCGKPL